MNTYQIPLPLSQKVNKSKTLIMWGNKLTKSDYRNKHIMDAFYQIFGEPSFSVCRASTGPFSRQCSIDNHIADSVYGEIK